MKNKRYAVGIFFKVSMEMQVFIVSANTETEAIFKSLEKSFINDIFDKDEFIKDLHVIRVDTIKFALIERGWYISDPVEIK